MDKRDLSIKEFLEDKLNRYLKEMTRLESCNLYDTVLSEVEKALIAIVLKETKGNQLRAAKTLGVNRNTLRAKIKEYKIKY
ncbi:MAG: helix-turn-helix domain-containing protein [Nitrospirota bacterium]